MARKKKKGKTKLLITTVILLTIGSTLAYLGYGLVFNSNVVCNDCKYVYIPTNSTFEDVVAILKKDKIIKDTASFKLVAKYMKYPEQVKAGKYGIKPGMSNKDLISLLRSGRQVDVKLVLNATDSKKELAEILSDELEADGTQIYNMIRDNEYLKKYGYTTETVYAMFIPDTYFFKWNTSAEEVLERFNKETNKFWESEDRTAKIEAKGLTKIQAVIIASIVDKETNKVDEMSTIAGLYINRFKQGWKLQADPTVKFAVGNLGLRRVLKVHTEYPSPYNTYYSEGLPPGPICLPSKQALEAVINSRDHDYMFMCASVDKIGYHAFAVTNAEHERNAAKYHRYLNNRGVR